jgi:hypothetical protein
MAEDMGRLLAKSTIRIILQNTEDILRSFEAIPGKKASKIRSKFMLEYEQILTVEVKDAFSRCNLTRSRIISRRFCIGYATKKKTTDLFKKT